MDGPFEDISTSRVETGAIVFDKALAYIDCTFYGILAGGDHTIYVGQVEAFETQQPDADSLTFFRGNYGTIR